MAAARIAASPRTHHASASPLTGYLAKLAFVSYPYCQVFYDVRE